MVQRKVLHTRLKACETQDSIFASPNWAKRCSIGVNSDRMKIVQMFKKRI